MPAKPRSRTPAARSCAASGAFWVAATSTTPAISDSADQRGRTPARIVAQPKASPAITIAAPPRNIQIPSSSLSVS